jgi:hypothetical protein
MTRASIVHRGSLRKAQPDPLSKTASAGDVGAGGAGGAGVGGSPIPRLFKPYAGDLFGSASDNTQGMLYLRYTQGLCC